MEDGREGGGRPGRRRTAGKVEDGREGGGRPGRWRTAGKAEDGRGPQGTVRDGGKKRKTTETIGREWEWHGKAVDGGGRSLTQIGRASFRKDWMKRPNSVCPRL